MTAIRRLVRLLNEMEVIGPLIREARGDERQEDLAARAGITPVYLSRIETGLARPTKKVLMKIISAVEFRGEMQKLWRRK